jgi:gliding motility associated protien GldN
MNQFIFKISSFTLCVSVITSNAVAQRTPRNQQANTQNSAASQQQVNKPPITNFNSTIPIRYDTADGPGAGTNTSLRNGNVTDKGVVNDRIPLPYEHLRWDDALYSEKVWRELDLREKMNQTFRYDGTDDNGSQMFINILLKAVSTGQVTAFSTNDDRFTTVMTPAEINRLTRGVFDTAEIRELGDPNVIKEYLVTRKAFDPKTVTKIRIKEEWVFDREASRMFCRIIGIAPVMTRYNDNGTERGSVPLFWIYYPDLRPVLANHEVYNAKNQGNGSMTWEELFEARMFSSYIVKSTLDNPGNKTIRQMYPKDAILALQEGDKIKERISSYEQDLWSY